MTEMEFSKSHFATVHPWALVKQRATGCLTKWRMTMSKTTITLAFQVEDAEPILRAAAREAAEYGSLLDYATRKTGGIRHWRNGATYDEARKDWQRRFAKAKRMVEAFGIDYEPVSEGETMTVDHRYVGGKTVVKNIPGIGPVGWTTGSEPDYDNPYPAVRGEIHTEACRQAADRAVRRWRETIQTAKAA